MSNAIRIGVIGTGIMGRQYIRIFQDDLYAKVTAVAARRMEKIGRAHV